ncbi:unnamed protein product, partial [Tenebrio molitor]
INISSVLCVVCEKCIKKILLKSKISQNYLLQSWYRRSNKNSKMDSLLLPKWNSSVYMLYRLLFLE